MVMTPKRIEPMSISHRPNRYDQGDQPLTMGPASRIFLRT
jgi:hypothetical protein